MWKKARAARMNNAAKLARKYRKTDLSPWTYSREDRKAFSPEMTRVGDATEIAMDHCLEDEVPEYEFYFYCWVGEASEASCREFLKSLRFDDDTSPRIITVCNNPDYM
jgi:hypothetical protein